MAFKPPQKAKRDGNEPEIVEALEAHGITVELTDQPLDSILGFGGRNYLAEFKNGPKAPFTKGQEKFLAEWPGQAVVIRSVDEAIAFAKQIRSGK